MKLVFPSVEIIAMPDHPLELIELAGRTCYKSEEKITEGSAVRFVEMIIKLGHESVLEHVSVSARIICDRGFHMSWSGTGWRPTRKRVPGTATTRKTSSSSFRCG